MPSAEYQTPESLTPASPQRHACRIQLLKAEGFRADRDKRPNCRGVLRTSGRWLSPASLLCSRTHCSARTRQRAQYGGEQWRDTARRNPPLRVMRATPRLRLWIGAVSDSISHSTSRSFNRPGAGLNANHASRKVLELSQRCARQPAVYDNLMSPIPSQRESLRAYVIFCAWLRIIQESLRYIHMFPQH
jgi:hypothetical protein